MPKIMELIAILFKPEFKICQSWQSRGGITPELTRRPTIATTRIEPTNDDERQAKGGRVE